MSTLGDSAWRVGTGLVRSLKGQATSTRGERDAGGLATAAATGAARKSPGPSRSRRRLFRRRVPALAALGVILSATVLPGQVGKPSGRDGAGIARIEHTLVTPVVIKGRPVGPRALADRMAALRIPAVSVAVFDDYRIIWARAYGMANREARVAASPDTLFQAASISKPVAAVAALRLVEQGRLDLDGAVNARLTSWKVPDNEFTRDKPVTLRHLLTHSGGLTVHGFRGYAAGEAVPTLVQVLDGLKPANSAAVRADVSVGSRWRYSGGGFTVMQQLLIDVVGKPFPAIMRDLVLDPAAMRLSGYEQPLPEGKQASAATGYRASGQAVPGRWHTYPEMAAAGLWTTPSDLARFAIEIQKAAAGRGGALLSPSMAREMIARQFENWGLGFTVAGADRDARFSHGGANEGFRCMLIAWKEGGKGIAVMTSSDAGGELGEEIVRTVAHEYAWPGFAPVERTLSAVDPATLPSFAGQYEVAPGQRLTVVAEGGRLFLQLPGSAPRMELFPESGADFFALERNVRLGFVRSADGRIDEVILRRPGNDTHAKRVGLQPRGMR